MTTTNQGSDEKTNMWWQGSFFQEKEIYWVPTVLFALSYFLYANTFGHPWIYDDLPVIIENPDIRSLTDFWRNTYPTRPLRELSFMLDYLFFGMDPRGWHIQQIFWHGFNSVLIFTLARRLMPSVTVAWCTALVFLCHPINVEVVANISHRKDSLALAFSLLCVLLWWRGLELRRNGRIWLTLSVGCAVIALFAKQNALAVLLPLLVLTLPYMSTRCRRWVLGGGSAALIAGGVWWFLSVGGWQGYLELVHPLMIKMNYLGASADGRDYVLLLLKSWGLMLKNFFLPLQLAPEYTFSFPTSLADGWVVGALLAVVGYLVALFVSWRRSSAFFFPLVWFGAFWLPTSNLLPLSYFVADRYLYTPSVGLIVALSGGLFWLCRRNTRVVIGVCAVLILVLAGLTWRQNQVWRSPVSLWSQALSVSPDSTSALNNLGTGYMLEGEYRQALPLFLKAAKNFNDSLTLYNLGWAYEMLGDKRSAIRYYSIFISMNEPEHQLFVSKAKRRLGRL